MNAFMTRHAGRAESSTIEDCTGNGHRTRTRFGLEHLPRPFSAIVLRFEGGFGASDDLRKASRIQARTADQRAVDILLAHQFLCVVGLNASAVLDSNPVSCSSIGEPGQHRTNKRVRLLGLGRRGGSSGSNGPTRLISQDEFGKILLRYSFQTFTHLPLQNLLHLIAVPFVERFAHAKNGTKTGIQRRSHLTINDLVCFAEQRPPFAMTQRLHI